MVMVHTSPYISAPDTAEELPRALPSGLVARAGATCWLPAVSVAGGKISILFCPFPLKASPKRQCPLRYDRILTPVSQEESGRGDCRCVTRTTVIIAVVVTSGA
jgi:hypothetical protein